MNNFLTLIIICVTIISIMGIIDPQSTISSSILKGINGDNPTDFANSKYALLLIGGAGILFVIAQLVKKLLDFGTLNAQTLVMQGFVTLVVTWLIADLSAIYTYTSSVLVGEFAFFGAILKIIWIVLALSIVYYGYKMLVGSD